MNKYFEPTFPLIEDVLKQLEKQLDEAIWNEESTEKIQKQIENLKILKNYGESYVVPF